MQASQIHIKNPMIQKASTLFSEQVQKSCSSYQLEHASSINNKMQTSQIHKIYSHYT